VSSPPARDSPGFDRAIELFLEDMFSLGRLTTDHSIAEYRRTVRKHAEDAGGARPDATTRDHIKQTLRRWSHPNTKRRKRSMLVSFYDWMVEEGLRPENPARQIRAPRGREPRVRRLTLDETRAFLAAAEGRIERRMAYLAACAGLRCSELRLLRGLHFAREGWILISADLAKGGRERWVPVMVDLEPVVSDIRATTPDEHHVLPATELVGSAAGSFRSSGRSARVTARRSGARCAASVAARASARPCTRTSCGMRLPTASRGWPVFTPRRRCSATPRFRRPRAT